jgi:hypothetical protein
MTENQKGERVFVDTWEIYRLHFGMEEWEYYIFHNEEYFADFHDYSRPAPPAPESLCEGCTAEDEMCGKVPSECYSRYQENIEKAKAHDAQVAKAEREKVLKDLLYNIDGETGFYVFPHSKATIGNGLSRFVLLDDLTALVESLRAQQEAEQPKEGRR